MPRGRRPILSPREAEAICARYKAGETPNSLARQVGVDRGTIVNYLKRAGIFVGDRRPGRHKHPEGYVFVAVPRSDPMRCMASNGKVLEHRLVVARHLGRPLRSDESVHHINGVRDDNRIENLQLRQGRHGVGMAARCGNCGSQDIVFEGVA